MSLFLILQFNYCPLVWICHSRSMNNKINRLHETCDHIIYSDKTSSSEELCRKTDLSSYEHLKKTCEHLQLKCLRSIRISRRQQFPIFSVFEIILLECPCTHVGSFQSAHVRCVSYILANVGFVFLDFLRDCRQNSLLLRYEFRRIDCFLSPEITRKPMVQ